MSDMKVPQICREYKFAHFCPCRTGFSLSEGFPKPDQHRFVLAEKSIRDLIEEYVVPPALWYLQKTRNPRLASWAINKSWLWHWAYFFRPHSSFFFILHPCPNAPPRACKRRGYRECIHRVRSPRLASWVIDMSWLRHWGHFLRPHSSFFFILHPCPDDVAPPLVSMQFSNKSATQPRACKRRGYRECEHRVHR
jgi:hypothetical protein